MRYQIRWIALAKQYQIWDAQDERWAEFETGGIYSNPRKRNAQDYIAQLTGTAPAPRPWQDAIERARAGQSKEQS